MVAPKSKRKDLQVPEWVAKEWRQAGQKTAMAQLLQAENFCKDFGAGASMIILGKNRALEKWKLEAPKPKHIKQDPPNNGQILNKRRPKHIKEGLCAKVSATVWHS